MPIPAFSGGLLPPFEGGDATTPLRSPYQATMVDVVTRFALSPPRIEILSGLLRFRALLRQVGVTQGFQWLNGSFMEERSPRDIDVVTFHAVGASNVAGLPQTDFDAAVALAGDHHRVKASMKCDAYFIYLEWPRPYLVRQVAYWLSLFSHTRAPVRWKGLVQVDLGAPDDAADSLLRSQAQRLGVSP